MNRTLTFAHKYFGGLVPALHAQDSLDAEIVGKLKEAPQKLGRLIDKYQFKAYVREFMDLARFANKYFNDKKPWKTRQVSPENCETTIHLCLQTVYTLSVLAEPLLPFSVRKIWKMLNIKPQTSVWQEAGNLNLTVGHKLNPPEILFTKIEDEVIQAEIEKLNAVTQAKAPEQSEEELIDVETFSKIKLRVAEIISAEKIKKSDRLLLLRVRLDKEIRQLVAGIAGLYDPAELPGK